MGLVIGGWLDLYRFIIICFRCIVQSINAVTHCGQALIHITMDTKSRISREVKPEQL